ncbi:M28 family peptidase [Ravibacter arvi]|uniref:M28 family peptidase n=1 Tax=Ravibacter arvi TaxID=2051041 RepID=A0ABP8LTQ5_9BACT
MIAVGCQSRQQETETTRAPADAVQSRTPAFTEDSAYYFVKQQVDFGPRVPNTKAHESCGDYLVRKLRSFGWQAIEQKFRPTTFDGKKLNARNIIGIYNPDAKRRILLAAHWDSRPFADADKAQKNSPVPAANDGASGVGVLLEIARTIGQDKNNLNIGVDIIFFDAEDWGNSGGTGPDDEYMGGFCLGSQYWAQNKHLPQYSAYYGILLDMVGAKNATFPKESLSMMYAGDVVNKVWDTAKSLGYGAYFVDVTGFGVGVDDHVAVNKIAKIPMIDIIHLDPASGSFFEHWHTVHDTMESIDPKTLKAVGQTVLEVLYLENTPPA